MNFDQKVNELLEQYYLEENLLKKLGTGAAMLGAGAMALVGGMKGKQPEQKEVYKKPEISRVSKDDNLRRIEAGMALARGEEPPTPRYSPSDKSPQAEKYRRNIERIKAAEALLRGEEPASRYAESDRSPEAQRYFKNKERIKKGMELSKQ
jgi:hypothetical protein